MPSCSPLVMSMKIINNQPIIRIDVRPGGTVVKNPPVKAGDARDMGLILVSGMSPGEGNGNPLQYSRLRYPMDRGAWRATVPGSQKNQVQLSN